MSNIIFVVVLLMIPAGDKFIMLTEVIILK